VQQSAFAFDEVFLGQGIHFWAVRSAYVPAVHAVHTEDPAAETFGKI
jgi:hypothetical protein